MSKLIVPTKPSQQIRFLRAFAETGNMMVSCQAAGVDRRLVYAWRQDPEFAERFEEARQDALGVLEAEAYRRAVTGWDEPLVYQGSISINPKTKQPITVKKFDSTLLIFLMKGAAPEKYRDTWKGEIRHTAIVSRGPDLTKLTHEQLDELERIAQALIPAGEAVIESRADPAGEAEAPEEQN